MLRRERQIRIQIQKAVDAGLMAVALFLAHWVRSASGIQIFGGTRQIQTFDEYVWLMPVIFLLTPLWFETQGFYNRPALKSRRATTWHLLRGCVMASVSIVLILFFFKEQLSRSVTILFGFIGFALVLTKEGLVHYWGKTKFGASQFKRRVILLGSRQETEVMAMDLEASPENTIEVLAELDLNEASMVKLEALLHEHSANGVILCAKHTYFDQVEKVIQMCELEGVEVWLVAEFFKTQVSRTTLDEFYGRPMMVFRSTPEVSWQGVAKQVVDVLGALFLLLVTSPILAAVAALIKITSPGPVFFKQSRSGLNGQPFTMLKFRSMVTNAEQLKQELANFNEMGGPVFKMTHDPRVTRIGRFIRKYSLDEFPQLFNVLLGDMSLVGPRPLPVDETRRFDDFAHRRRLSVKPGLTCLWQISGRSNVKDFKDWVRLDLEYIDNWSLWLDIKILWKTIPVVLSGSGAK